MVNKNQNKKNYLNLVSTFIKYNLKNLIILFLGIFLIFLSFQVYTYYKKNKINNLSIVYFENKNLEDKLTKYLEMKKISNEKGFYSVLSKLELINNNIENGDFDQALALYEKILNSDELSINYISLIAMNAAYNFIDIVIKHNKDKYINNINNFISLIDEELDNYIGNKNELLYLVSILSLNSDSNYKNNSELLTLYDNIINNEKISLTIKERVKKIHEFYTFI
ncbi:hypothetical protein IDH28_01940 [Pelagibacterales bacterium SAG-MED31]|nr:hypothetical protein [Pelagibacterales bacterium SAG-MED31]